MHMAAVLCAPGRNESMEITDPWAKISRTLIETLGKKSSILLAGGCIDSSFLLPLQASLISYVYINLAKMSWCSGQFPGAH